MKFVNTGRIIMALFFIMATAVNIINPIFEGPDELQHYQFVRYLQTERSLPIQELDGPQSQSHQPPLYYVLGAALTAGVDYSLNPTPPDINPHWTSYKPWLVHKDNKSLFLPRLIDRFPYQGVALSMHLIRLLSTVLSTASVGIMWTIAQALFSERPWAAVLLTTAVAFNPMFVYIGGSVNNDSLIILLVTGHIWLVWQALRNGYDWRTCVLLGVTWGLALLAKLPGLFACSLWGLGLLAYCADEQNWWDLRRFNWGFLFGRCVLITSVFLLVAGWWFVRNIMVYDDPLALERVIAVWGARAPEQYNFSHISADVRSSWQNFWGRFGYGQIVFHQPFYWVVNGLSSLALLGLIQVVRKRRGRGDKPPLLDGARSGLWLVLTAAWPLYVAALFYYIYRNPTGGNGRYTYPVIVGFAALFSLGLTTLLGRWRKQGVLFISAVLFGLSIYSIGFLQWTYLSPAGQELSTDTPQLWAWGGGQVRLLSTAFNQRTIYPGDELELTACWVSETAVTADYTLFLNGVDGSFNKYVDRNTQMGLGTYPTSHWPVGEPFCERYKLPTIEVWTDLPVVVPFNIGFVDTAAEITVQTEIPNGEPQDFMTVGPLKFVPEQPMIVPPLAYASGVSFTQGVTLVDFEFVDGDDGATVRLGWESTQDLSEDLTLFVHVLDETGELVAQSDVPPQTATGIYPTTFWGNGRIVTSQQLPLTSDLLEEMTVLVGLYRPDDFVRLPLATPDPQYGDVAVLTWVQE